MDIGPKKGQTNKTIDYDKTSVAWGNGTITMLIVLQHARYFFNKSHNAHAFKKEYQSFLTVV